MMEKMWVPCLKPPLLTVQFPCLASRSELHGKSFKPVISDKGLRELVFYLYCLLRANPFILETNRAGGWEIFCYGS